MIETFSPVEKQSVHVVADTFYACSEIMQVCRKNSYVFVSAINKNRVVTIEGKRQSIDTFIRRTHRKTKNKKRVTMTYGTYEILCRKGSLKSEGAVNLIYTRNLSHRTVKDLFATDLALPYKTIFAIYQIR